MPAFRVQQISSAACGFGRSSIRFPRLFTLAYRTLRSLCKSTFTHGMRRGGHCFAATLDGLCRIKVGVNVQLKFRTLSATLAILVSEIVTG